MPLPIYIHTCPLGARARNMQFSSRPLGLRFLTGAMLPSPRAFIYSRTLSLPTLVLNSDRKYDALLFAASPSPPLRPRGTGGAARSQSW